MEYAKANTEKQVKRQVEWNDQQPSDKPLVSFISNQTTSMLDLLTSFDLSGSNWLTVLIMVKIRRCAHKNGKFSTEKLVK